ncbi:TetR/AcrR family transcriptional regulator [Actinocorallia populi]|uniref:TetR/AcrR family transcriptional regulator n=1 Tax=Actinocorallia populi TaxID=2079200 RepID=UPI000D095231|nr:TetR/AcrR family transcriptional regulator [Actinocorallia populi]
MTVYAAQGDPRRTMALLWGVRDTGRRPGPKQGLSVELIVATGVAVADERGMAELSMRAVAERLGRTAMALYTYVPGKNELVDLMYDSVHAELPVEYDLRDGWRAAMAARAEDLWDFHLRHPWTLQVSQARPVLGPCEYRMLETSVRILRESGLSAPALRRGIWALHHFIRGSAQAVAEARQAAAATGLSDDDWWYARSEALEEIAPDFAARFPVITWMENEGAFQMEDETVPYLEQEARETFAAGLVALLDGIETTLAGSRGDSLDPGATLVGSEGE